MAGALFGAALSVVFGGGAQLVVVSRATEKYVSWRAGWSSACWRCSRTTSSMKTGSMTQMPAAKSRPRSLPAVRERLLGHRLDYPGAATDPAFPTRTGRRQHPDNVRARILAPIRERANELLAAEGRLPIRHLTPHTLRRTFASILAVCNVPPRRAMYLLGHADPTLTLAVYQQVLDMRSAAVAELEETIGATLTEAHEILCGRGAEDRVLVMSP